MSFMGDWSQTERSAEEFTSRGLHVASVFDLQGVASLTVLIGKRIYREVCDQRLPWDAALPEKLDNSGTSTREA